MKRRSAKSDLGFTLLEVLVSLCLVALGTVSAAKMFSNQLSFNNRAEKRSDAVAAAQQVLDRLRVTDPSTMPTSGTSAAETITVGNYQFSVTTTYCRTTSYCSTGSIRMVTINVSYRGQSQYSVDTIYAQLR